MSKKKKIKALKDDLELIKRNNGSLRVRAMLEASIEKLENEIKFKNRLIVALVLVGLVGYFGISHIYSKSNNGIETNGKEISKSGGSRLQGDSITLSDDYFIKLD